MDPVNLIGYAIVIFTVAFINAYIDYHIISSGGRVRHALESVIRFSIIFALSWYTIPTLLFGLSIFWIVFEIVLNRLRDKHWLYVGYTAMSDKLIRRMFGDTSDKILFSIKITILLISLYLIFKF